jgi:3-oxoacyl-[acyl-carrier protein] reductase
VTDKCGPLYGLINNAALGHDGVLATQHETQIEELIRVNVQAPVLLAKYASRSMLIGGEGRIVQISSIIASTGFNGLAVYGATKAAMIGFTKSLARELGAAKITVNSVAPGYMETEMTSSLGEDQLAKIVRRSPMNKLVDVRDVARAVIYLLSEDARLVTGTTLTVDAGSTC